MIEIKGTLVRQWVTPEWTEVDYDAQQYRRQPQSTFYLFSMKADFLKRLSGVYRRDPKLPPAEDLSIQRKYREDRSEEIARYVRDGFPLSRIDRKKLVDPSEAHQLRMPGWLPSAVVINILPPDDQRGIHKKSVDAADLISVVIDEATGSASLQIPDHCANPQWQPAVHPIEVIDGQHRLWAFEAPTETQPPMWSDAWVEELKKFEIPVVAFCGLDITWQAYLFYTINQLPKRIDTSMVFDLYPLLRHQDWLERFEGPNIYRETRAQDLTISLWQHPLSPWKDRIVRLGGREKGKVTQAAFLRSLMASFIKRWSTARIGGLFGSPSGTHETELPWDKEQQAAFLIKVWLSVKSRVVESTAPWATALAGVTRPAPVLFEGPETLLATDQGVRCILSVVNDLLARAHLDNVIDLSAWDWQRKAEMSDEDAISDAVASLDNELPDAAALLNEISGSISSFDWRVSSAVDRTDPQYSVQSSYRGSSGYREIRVKLIDHISHHSTGTLQQLANAIAPSTEQELESE